MPTYPDIVFIHGMWSCGHTAAPLREYLENRGHTVHCPTLPAHEADSRSLVDQLSMHDYVDAICRYIDSQDFAQPPILIGHSMGGLIAQMVATKRQCGPIVLMSSAGPAGVNHICWHSFRTTWRILTRPFFWKKSHRPDWESARYGLLNRVDEERACELCDSFRFESGRALGELVFWFLDPTRATRLVNFTRVPMLIISGNQDKITPPRVARKLARLYPQAELVEYPEHSHWILEEPGREVVFERIVDWIESSSEVEAELSTHHGVSSRILSHDENAPSPDLPSPQIPPKKPPGNRTVLDHSGRLRGGAHENTSAN